MQAETEKNKADIYELDKKGRWMRHDFSPLKWIFIWIYTMLFIAPLFTIPVSFILIWLDGPATINSLDAAIENFNAAIEGLRLMHEDLTMAFATVDGLGNIENPEFYKKVLIISLACLTALILWSAIRGFLVRINTERRIKKLLHSKKCPTHVWTTIKNMERLQKSVEMQKKDLNRILMPIPLNLKSGDILNDGLYVDALERSYESLAGGLTSSWKDSLDFAFNSIQRERDAAKKREREARWRELEAEERRREAERKARESYANKTCGTCRHFRILPPPPLGPGPPYDCGVKLFHMTFPNRKACKDYE